MPKSLTEDQVRDQAKTILGFDDGEKDVVQGTGQLTTFNMIKELNTKFSLSEFEGVTDKPDGWYFPKDTSSVAIVIETKDSRKKVTTLKWVNELLKNVAIANKKYSKVIGILWNGYDIRVFKNNEEVIDDNKVRELENKTFYIKLFAENKIDKQEIYRLTKQINDSLNNKFGISNLYHRMIFTACALVATRYGAVLTNGMGYEVMRTAILETLKEQMDEDKRKNQKLHFLEDVYKSIEMNTTSNQDAINKFIENVKKISEHVNSDYWNGEDVMGIFFNEFNRYRPKAMKGQVFTPDHITSFMYRLIEVNKNDRVLDAACGSGAFLVKSMCNMINELGGKHADGVDDIRKEHLYGIEFDREIFALACANMLIHEDGKTNLEQLDSREEPARKWIREKDITKVLMNPPFETKYGCMDIVNNVLDNVPAGTLCAFILPDKKLEKEKSKGKKFIKKHTLLKIVKLPEKTFDSGTTTSVFVFQTGIPQGDKDIIGYYIEEDGLETVKNQGRQDIKNRWDAIEDYWIKAIRNGDDSKYHTKQTINPKEHLSYQMPEKPFEIYEEDFIKTMMDYEMFKQGIDVKEFGEQLLKKVLYNSEIRDKGDEVNISLQGGMKNED